MEEIGHLPTLVSSFPSNVLYPRGTGFWAGSWELAVRWVADSPGCFLVGKGDPRIKSGLDCFTSPGPEQQCDSSVIRLECHFFVSLLRGIIPPAIGLRNSHSEPVLNKALRTAFVASQNKSEMQRVPNYQATPSPRGPGSPRNCGGVRPPWESKIADYSPRGKHTYTEILCRVPQTFICVNSILTSDPEPAPSPGLPP